jgi:hypothetical protein
MSELGEILDGKFDEALDRFNGGKNSVIIDRAKFWADKTYELIGLDCEDGEPHRYLASRPTVGSSPITINSGIAGVEYLECNYWMLQMSRNLGDRRRLEDLPPEAIRGETIIVDAKQEIVMPQSAIKPLGRQAVSAFARELGGLRVAEDISNVLEIHNLNDE